jgi:hypothetical protein
MHPRSLDWNRILAESECFELLMALESKQTSQCSLYNSYTLQYE